MLLHYKIFVHSCRIYILQQIHYNPQFIAKFKFDTFTSIIDQNSKLIDTFWIVLEYLQNIRFTIAIDMCRKID
jgi:hypothetical protein